MDKCIFCKILNGDIKAKKVYEDDYTLAFHDISPQAPTHLLVITREHFSGIHEIPDEKMEIIAKLFIAVSKVVTQEGLVKNGYRIVLNSGKESGQEVPHIHVHILAGRPMHWPPG